MVSAYVGVKIYSLAYTAILPNAMAYQKYPVLSFYTRAGFQKSSCVGETPLQIHNLGSEVVGKIVRLEAGIVVKLISRNGSLSS